MADARGVPAPKLRSRRWAPVARQWISGGDMRNAFVRWSESHRDASPQHEERGETQVGVVKPRCRRKAEIHRRHLLDGVGVKISVARSKRARARRRRISSLATVWVRRYRPFCGMTIEPRCASPDGPPPYPHMLRWLR
jgi:hypothetical protein